MTAPVRIEPLAKHDRDDFDCGNEALTTCLQRQAGQDQRKRFSVCYLLIGQQTDAIAGYYTLSSGGVDVSQIPERLQRKLPRYPTVPIVRIGRLAVASMYQGQKLGSVLLFDAINRTSRAEIGVHAVIVDAIDRKAELFYEHHGFLPLPSAGNVLFLPISDALKRLVENDTPH